jgi:hypothetical protein
MCLLQITDLCCTRIWASTQCSNYSSSLDRSAFAPSAIGSTFWSSTNSVAHACSVRFPFLPLHILSQSRADQILSHSVRLRRLQRRPNRRMHHRLHLPTNRPPQRRQRSCLLPLPPHRMLLLLGGRDVLYLYTSEIFPALVRVKGLSVSISGSFVVTIIFLQCAPTAFEEIGWSTILCSSALRRSSSA